MSNTSEDAGTGRVLRTQQIAEKHAILSAIVESSDDAIVSKNLDGIIMSWNAGAERIFGYTEQEVIGKHISILIPHELMSEEEHIISNIKQGNKISHYQTERRSKSGRIIPISLTVSPVKSDDGTIIGASKIARDISDQLLREAEIVEAAKENARLLAEIKAISAKKDEFMALASHELRTPLTSIKGYMQLLARRIEDGKDALIAKTVSQVDKLNALVLDLFDVSKIESGKLQLSFEYFSLRSLISEVLETLGHTHPSHHITFDPAAEDEVKIYADIQRIEQVLVNLVSNAVKYSPEGSTVAISLKLTDGSFQIFVRDEGLGLTAEEKEQIFDRFYRADNVGHISGLGLGLYLCKEILERHGGGISVESALGKGSTFVVSLPVQRLA